MTGQLPAAIPFITAISAMSIRGRTWRSRQGNLEADAYGVSPAMQFVAKAGIENSLVADRDWPTSRA